MSVCPACGLGWCGECGTSVRTATLCPQCEGLCVPSRDFGAREELERQRSTSLFDDLPIIVRYPLTDPMALGLLAIVVWVFTIARHLSFGFYGAGASLLFSQGLLMAYAFNALLKVSNGQMRGFVPEISDVWDLAVPLRQSAAALVASWWPMGLVIALAPGILGGSGLSHLAVRDPTPVAYAQDYERDTTGDAEGDPSPDPVGRLLSEADRDSEGGPIAGTEPPSDSGLEGTTHPPVGRALGALLLLAIALVWGVVYSPIALIVAVMARDEGLLQGFLQPLNPLTGVLAIRRMESTYWQAMAIYLLIVVGEAAAGLICGLIPILGSAVMAWVACYARVATGCALGLAVFKRSRELGLA